MNPTWYDVLGLTPDATPAEVKAAWRNATDKFEPGSGSGQFRMFNEAADVLLDPDRRRAYDAELATGTASDPVDPQAPAAPTADGGPTTHDARPSRKERREAAREERAEATTAGATPAAEPHAARASRRMAVLGLVVLPLLAVAALVAAGVTWHDHHQDGLVTEARTEAPAAAERGLSVLLAYDYRHMAADQKAGDQVVTPSYAHGKEGYDATFNLLVKGKNGQPGPAVSLKSVVTADVLDTAVVDASANRVRVLVFVNQTSRKGSAAPVIFQNRVVADMVHSGDQWLIDDITSY